MDAVVISGVLEDRSVDQVAPRAGVGRGEHPRNVYLREYALTDPLDEWLASAFTPDHLDQTITAMCDAQPTDTTPQTAAAQATIAACDAKLAQYRAALDAGADPALVTGWITQTQAERTRAEVDLQTLSRQSHAG
ncbi:hypothetical protein [Micromonospora sp. B9E7]|uniref:hypothetical protein n=1 Tax=Micromonospora sp. B9E7 TaxID=3153574 RepID=UPI00325CDAF1